jgi:hypothetical protein
MADKKISDLTALTGANVADTDLLPIVDTSATETKKITFAEFKTALDTSTGFVRITGDTMTGNLSFGDNNKAIFGDGSDLQIYHNGSASLISEQGTGSLIILASGLDINNAANTENMLTAYEDGAVTLYYDSAAKLATTATGIDVTGTVVADGLTVSNADGSIVKLESTGAGLGAGVVIGAIQFYGNDASPPGAGIKASITATTVSALGDDSQLMFSTSNGVTNNVNRMRLDNIGDISFYEDTGNTAKMVWSGYNEKLTLSGTGGIEVSGTVVADGLTVDSGSGANQLTLARSTTYSGLSWSTLISDFGGGGSDLIFDSTGANTGYGFRTRDSGDVIGKALVMSPNRDISFYEDTGTTAKFFWDASAEGLGVGYDPTVATDTALSVSSLTGDVGTNPVQQWKYTNDNNTMLRLRQIVTSGLVKHTFDLKNAGTDYNNNLVLDRGNVGIGTSSPSYPFHVTGSGDTVAAVTAGASSIAALNLGNSTNLADGGIRYDNGADALILRASNAERMRIDSSGGLITKPEAGGHAVFNEDGANADFRVESSDNDHMLFVDASNNGVGIGDGTTLANGLRISSSTGTTNAVDTKLYINADSSGTTTTGFGPGITFAGVRNGDGVLQQMAQINVVAEVNSGTTLSSGFQFMTATAGANTEKVRINYNGGFVVTPAAGGHAIFNEGAVDADFRVESATSTHALFVQGSDGNVFVGGASENVEGAFTIRPNTSNGSCLIQMNRASTVDTSNAIVFYNAGAGVGSITYTDSATAFNTSSDARLKDVTGEARGLEVINALNPVAYNWKNSGKADEGLIAQEVMEIVPKAVSKTPDDMYQMDYSKLVVHLVKGMKEQQAIIDNLTTRITALES